MPQSTNIRATMVMAVACFAMCVSRVERANAQQALSPDEALKHFKVAAGFEVQLYASEPLVRQPVTMTFDDRGRMWVIQYLQYPTPAGLKPVEVDQYLRTKYDKVPEPPPHGPRGADRVTILEDTDGDGRVDRAKDFVSGLNLASALAIGHGGVFVGQAPYLLFYADRDGDDVPDGDPEVLLKGFGMEDAHAVVNSMQWGPDGWLYGAQGSTVTADIRGVGFQQGVWRYHPVTKKFELLAEGGGNTWGLDFDRHGNAIAGTNFGERVLLHQVQGGYYVKGFAKHGPLHNPYTYGYFEHAPHQGKSGGHVTCGGIVYQGGAYPKEFANCYIGANLLSNAVYWHAVEEDRSTFKTRFVGELLSTDDIWFRPIDCLSGPDGSVFVADWYDERANHVIPEDTWDRSNGRIWRIVHKPVVVPDKAHQPQVGARSNDSNARRLSQRSTNELVALLADANQWNVREARRILAERRDATAYPKLRELAAGSDDALALQALWALYASGGTDEAQLASLLGHQTADVRTWAVRLLGDEKNVTSDTARRLAKLAHDEPQATVRSQLASTCKRLPGPLALPIAAELAKRDEDHGDPFIPLLLWWAVEDKAASDRGLVLGLLTDSAAWQRPLLAEVIAPRLVRRWAAEETDAGYAACAQLLTLAPTADVRQPLLAALEQQLAGRRLPSTPKALEKPLGELWRQAGDDPEVVRLALRLGSREAYDRALLLMADARQSPSVRVGLIAASGEARQADAVGKLLPLVGDSESEPVQMAALAALEHFADDVIATSVLSTFPKMPASIQARSLSLLTSRKNWSAALLSAVDQGAIKPESIPLDQLRRMLLHHDDALASAIERRWGKIRQATPGEKQAMIVVLNRTLSEGAGDAARGKQVYTKHCGTCHTLFGEGAKVGPDLTSVDRKRREFLLLNIVDPSGSIRPEFVSQTVVTKDGRIFAGLVVESTPETFTLVDAKNQRTLLVRDQIDELEPSPVSLMPEKILEPLKAEELRDLFGYLQLDGPVK